MMPSLRVRELNEAERAGLQAALRCGDVFTVRRAQILLASARGDAVEPIARTVGVSVQSVRNAIHAFDERRLESLVRRSSRNLTVTPTIDEQGRERLRHILHQSPRTFGLERSLWSLESAAEVCVAEGITPQRMSDETIRRALKALGSSWKRAKQWITSPDPEYARKKSNGTG
jgi:transposase